MTAFIAYLYQTCLHPSEAYKDADRIPLARAFGVLIVSTISITLAFLLALNGFKLSPPLSLFVLIAAVPLAIVRAFLTAASMNLAVVFGAKPQEGHSLRSLLVATMTTQSVYIYLVPFALVFAVIAEATGARVFATGIVLGILAAVISMITQLYKALRYEFQLPYTSYAFYIICIPALVSIAESIAGFFAIGALFGIGISGF